VQTGIGIKFHFDLGDLGAKALSPSLKLAKGVTKNTSEMKIRLRHRLGEPSAAKPS
jgi:hypothetical protein